MKLSEILKKHEIDDDKAIKDIEDYIGEKLTEKSDNMIPKSRFDEVIEQRNNLRADLSEKEGKLNNYEAKLEKLTESQNVIDELENKNKNLSKSLYDFKLSQWKEKAKIFENEKYKEKAEKIKDDFIFPDENKELTLEEIEKNIGAFKPYEKIGYFESTKDFDGIKPQKIKGKEAKDPLDKFDKKGD